MYVPRRLPAGAGTGGLMSWRHKHRRNPPPEQPPASLPAGEWLPVTVGVDPETGRMYILNPPGQQFAGHGSPYLTQKEARQPPPAEPQHGAAEQVPPGRFRRHRRDGSAHGRHVRRDEGKGHGSWSTASQHRDRTLFGVPLKTLIAELPTEVKRFTGVGWIGLSASIVGSVVFNSAVAGFLFAFAIAPFQGVISGVVNVLQKRKATPVDKEQNRAITEVSRVEERLLAEVRELRSYVDAKTQSGDPVNAGGRASAGQPAPETGTPPQPASTGAPAGYYTPPHPSYFVAPNGFYGPPPGYGVPVPFPGQVPTAPVPVYHPYAAPVAVAVAVPVYHQAPSGQGMAPQTAAQPRRGEDPRAPTNQEPRGHTPPTR